jgi:hypothetical protein
MAEFSLLIARFAPENRLFFMIFDRNKKITRKKAIRKGRL